jgi:hypothetical protein
MRPLVVHHSGPFYSDDSDDYYSDDDDVDGEEGKT